MKSTRITVLASAIGLAIASAGITAAPAIAHAGQTSPAGLEAQQNGVPNPSGRYFITFSEPGLVNYQGGIQSIPATAPHFDGIHINSSRKLQIHSAAAQSYKAFLTQKRQQHLASAERAIGHALDVKFVYEVTRNAVSVHLTPAEAARIARLDGVKSVTPVGVASRDSVYGGPTFIGATGIWDGSKVPAYASATKGEGIKIGVIDTGTNEGHPSFTNDPMCGFSSANPKLHPRDCTSTDGSGVCNGPDPNADSGDGHGVHTSSTAAGNLIDNTVTPAPFLPDGVSMAGIAPCASVYAYRVADHSNGSLLGDYLLAAVENAIMDQVDVVNYSIGPTCGGGNPWNQLQFLDMESADIFVAASAGNTRTGQCEDPTGLVGNNGPWVTTVAASTQDEQLGPQLQVAAPAPVPAPLQEIALTPGSTTLQAPDTTDLNDATIRSYPTNPEACTTSGGIPAGTFAAGEIAVLQRGSCNFSEKITNAANAGADFVIIANNQPGDLSMDTTGAPTSVAAFSIDQTHGDALISFADSNPPPANNPDLIFADGFEVVSATSFAIADYHRVAVSAIQGDVLADFSFRGPTPAPYDNLTKPDIAAPGVNIYAALDAGEGSYGFYSGTSMSSPHIAGAAALVRATHPSWSPMEVKSALMTTASTAGFEEDGSTPWTADDVGSGRVDLSKASLAGLTLDESSSNFLDANPNGGTLDMRQLNLPSLRDSNCNSSCSWTRTFRNRLNQSGNWTIATDAPNGYTLSATPSSFSLAPGYTQTVTFTATASGAPQFDMQFGQIKLTEDNAKSPEQHLTVAVKVKPPAIATAPSPLTSTQEPDTQENVSLNVSNVGGGTLNWNFTSSGSGTIWEQANNGTSGIISTHFEDSDTGGYTAADFTISGGSSTVSHIAVQGFDNANLLASQSSITWAIYGDAAGEPDGDPDAGTGTPVWTYTAAPTSTGISLSGSGNISLDLAAAGQSLSLPAGTYWLSVYPSYADDSTRWNWSQGEPKGADAKLISSYFGISSWTDLSGLVSFADVAFQIDGTVTCGAPWLSLGPPTSGSLGGGGSDAVNVTFDSTGMADGTYTAYACIASNDPAHPVTTIPVSMTVQTAIAGCPVQQLFQDPSLEASDPGTGSNPYWTSTSTHGSTSICSAGLCGTNIPHTGTFYTWFGGWGSGAETGTLSQTVNIPTGHDRFVNFWLLRALSAGSTQGDAALQLTVDGNPVGTPIPQVAPGASEADYIQRSMQIPASYVDGNSHTVELKFVNTSDDMGNMFVDDVTLECTTPSP